MNSPLRVLAFAHDASRSGAVLLHRAWLSWALRWPERLRVRSVLARGGPLLAHWPSEPPIPVLPRWRRLLLKRGRCLPRCMRHNLCPAPFKLDADVVLVNTLALGWLLPVLKPKGPIVVHAHELARATRSLLHPSDAEWMRLHVAHWIAVSEAVRNHLIIELGVCDERINVVGNFPAEPVAAFSQAEARAIQAAAYGVDARKPWVLAVGNIGPVKAPELFIALAGLPELQGYEFIWVGGGLDTAYGRSLRQTPGAEHVRFLGAQSDVATWMKAADVLVVTSREESSSLVTLEAMVAGLPVIAFAGTGGPDEILAEGRGLLVPERSATAMAVAVQSCLSQSTDIGRMVKTAQSWVGHEANSNHQCEKLAAVLETVAAQKPHAR